MVSADTKKIIDDLSLNIEHISIYSTLKKPETFVRRALYEMRSTIRILKNIKNKKCDIYIITIPSMFLLFNLYILRGKKIYMDLRDLTWEYLDDSSYINYISKRLFRLAAKYNFRYVKEFIVTNDAEYKYLTAFKQNVRIIYNGVSQEQFDVLSMLPKKVADKRLVISYVGRLSIPQNIQTLVEAAKKLPQHDFNIIGYGEELAKLQKYSSLNNITNITFYPNVESQDVPMYYQKSDILYAQLKPEYLLAVPSKLYQYIASGRYIIYGGSGQAVELLNKFKHNMVIKACDSDKLVEAISSVSIEQINNFKFESNIQLIKEKYIREINVGRVMQDLI